MVLTGVRNSNSSPLGNEEEEDMKSILAELLEISNRSASSRFLKSSSFNKSDKLSHHCSINDKENDNGTPNVSNNNDDEESISAISFLQRHVEKVEMNQYWYSSTTIKSLSTGICEILSKTGGEKVAFLSTPSLYFAFPMELRKNCCLFDVSLKL